LRVGGAVQRRHGAEYTLASIIAMGAQITAAPLAAQAVEFRHAAPPALAEHRRIFGVVPRFSASVNALELDPAVLARPVPAADPMLSKVIERHAEALLAARDEPGAGVADRVRQLLAGALPDGDASLGAVAAGSPPPARRPPARPAGGGRPLHAAVGDPPPPPGVGGLAGR